MPSGKMVWSRTYIDVAEPTGVEVHVSIVWQHMLAENMQSPKSAGIGSNQSLSGMAVYEKSVSGMAAHEIIKGACKSIRDGMRQ